MLNSNSKQTNRVSDLSNENIIPTIVQECRSTDLILPVDSEDLPINSSKNEHLKIKKGTSNLETLMHIIKANIGTGVLGKSKLFKLQKTPKIFLK
jgi:hypothetical protein